MQKQFVSARTAFLALAVGAIGTITIPTLASAQAPSGSYRNSCRSITLARGGILQAECRTTNSRWLQSRIRVADCRNGDIANLNGRLVCITSGRGRNDGKQPVYRGNNGNYGNHGNNSNRNNGKYPNPRGNNGHGNNTRGNSSIVLFTRTQWNGRSMSLRSDNLNLDKTGFNDAVASVRIIGNGVWRLCSDKNYNGRCVNVSSGVRDLNSLGLRNKISSVRRMR